jgi:glycosyltransferase involved in cell wall biosynthesis
VHVVTYREGSFAEALSKENLPTILTSIGPKLSFKTLHNVMTNWKAYKLELSKIIQVYKPDFIFFQFKLETLLFSSFEVSKYKYAVLEHGPFPKKYRKFPWTRMRLKKVFSSAQALLAVSETAVRGFSDLGFESISIGAGVDDVFFENRIPYSPKRHGTVFAYVGRLEKEKGITKLNKIFSTSRLNHLSLVVAGEGSLRSEMERISNSSKNIEYLGVVTNAEETLRTADAGILLSKKEGRPLFVLECLAMGIPVFGLVQNQALVQLRREFGSEMLILASSKRDLVKRILAFRKKPRISSRVQTWSGVSKTILESIK